MTWLITGGAGYIGAHVVRDMLRSGRQVVVLDDLSTGRADRLPSEVPLVRGEVANRRLLRRALEDHKITAVMHFAARKQVGESVERPLHYWSQNIGSLQVLLEEMVRADIGQMVFSSSAAVYGQPDLSEPEPARPAPVRHRRTQTRLRAEQAAREAAMKNAAPGGAPPAGAQGSDTAQRKRAQRRITESTPCEPINPYGATKLAGEWMVGATAHTHGWRALSLRYFNVAGAGSPALGDPAALNLIPLVLDALDHGRRPKVFGDDYPTPDGTCIRDYIHVADLAAAHVAAARVVSAAHAATRGQDDAAAAVRAATERAAHAAAAAEQAAALLPGGNLAADAASHMPHAADAAAAAAQAASRAMELMPGASKALELATHRLPGAIRASAASVGVAGPASDIVAEVASQFGAIVARATGVEEGPRLAEHLAVNIGTGRGYSVLEVIEAIRHSTGKDFPIDVVGRRAGDPPMLVASPDLAAQLLGWRARHSLADMTDSAWAAWRSNH